jgi:hypothetical protein
LLSNSHGVRVAYFTCEGSGAMNLKCHIACQEKQMQQSRAKSWLNSIAPIEAGKVDMMKLFHAAIGRPASRRLRKLTFSEVFKWIPIGAAKGLPMNPTMPLSVHRKVALESFRTIIIPGSILVRGVE